MGKKSLRILLVEDSEDDAELVLLQLRREGYSIEHVRVQTSQAMHASLQNDTSWDVVLSDYNMPHFSGLDALELVRETGLDLPFIIVSGAIGEERAVDCMRAGAHDYVLKDNLSRLGPAVEREVNQALNRKKQRETEAQLRQSQKLEAIGQLAGGVAHDFNNLLTAIISFTCFVIDDLDGNDPRREDLGEVLRAADSATWLTGQLLSFSRRRPVEPVIVDLSETVTKADKILRRTLGEHIELVSQLDNEPLPVLFDPGELDQVILNLAVNARDAMPNGGHLSLRTFRRTVAIGEVSSARQTFAILEVEDNGTGMSTEVATRIFEPFFSTKGEKGTGLGLATCYGIVKQAGGDVEVASVEGQGTTFTIAIPLSGEAPVQRGIEADTHTTAISAGLRALVVEDQPAILRMMRRALQDIGFSVCHAQTAEEALALVEEGERVDLLVTDVVLPDLTGVQLAQCLRESFPEMRVVATSGYMDEDQRPLLRSSEQTVFLPKPFSAPQLLAKIYQLYSKPPGSKNLKVS